MAKGAHRAASSRLRLVALAVVTLLAAGIVWRAQVEDDSPSTSALPSDTATSTTAAPADTAAPDTSILVSAKETSPVDTTPVNTTAAPPAFSGWVNPASFGQPYGTTVAGMLTFRGNPTRSYYGQGPVPVAPKILWRFPPTGGLCHSSTDQHGSRIWCGTGWTGQANVWTNPKDGKLWLAFGAYDAAYHFLDPATGQRMLPDFPTGDIDKGSATVDPDGFPLYYAGSARRQLRVIALDRDKPTELWRLNAHDVSPTLWNNDWDGAPLVIDDYLFEGGENSQFHIVKLNRGYDADGKVTVSPQLVFHTPGWDDAAAAGHRRQGRLDRELGRDLGQHGVLRELGWARAGMGHQRVEDRRHADAGLPVLDRRRHRCVRRRSTTRATCTSPRSTNERTRGRKRSGS